MKGSGAILAAACMAAVCGLSALAAEEESGKAPAKPLIQLAVLLDTSSSMNGLINQARTQLWKIVNELATSKRGGVRPKIQVALYQYGTPSLGAQNGFIRQILPLTEDLDKVSQELFALTTSGGDEYCGWAIKDATDNLAWSANSSDYKAIVIAGNEPFTQGKVDFRASCKAAIGKGIIVNTIFCGRNDEGVRTNWQDGATLADGKYMNIDQNRQVAEIAAPQDAEIARLGGELNQTYVAFGRGGGEGKKLQAEAEKRADAAGAPVAAERALAKASGAYNNAAWDLVDAAKDKKEMLATLKDEDLPEEMKKMTPDERKAYVEKKAQERAAVQEQIRKLNEERKKFISAEMKKHAESGEKTLDAALIQAVREQAAKKEFKFE